MTAPPDRLFYDPSSGQTFLTGPGVEYVPKAAIADAEAMGREQGLREAVAICVFRAQKLWEEWKLGAGDTDPCKLARSDSAQICADAIAALIPAPPADGGYT